MPNVLKYVSYQAYRAAAVLGVLYVHARCYRPFCLAVWIFTLSLMSFCIVHSIYLFHWWELAASIFALPLFLMWFQPYYPDEELRIDEAFKKLELDTEHVSFNRLDHLVIHRLVTPATERALLAKRLDLKFPAGAPAPSSRSRL